MTPPSEPARLAAPGTATGRGGTASAALDGVATPVGVTPAGHGALRSLGGWYRRHVWAATAVLALIVLTAGFLVTQLVVGAHIGDGVTVAGVPVQGLTRDQAQARLDERLVPRLDGVTLKTAAGEELTLTLAQLGVSVDTAATARAAWRRGRHHVPLLGDVWLPGGGGEVAPRVKLDAAGFRQGLEAVTAEVDVPARDARLKIGGDAAVSVVPARAGSTVDAVALARAVSAAVAAGKPYSGVVPMRAVQPQVSTADAQSRAGAAAVYLARPITLRYRDREVVLTPEMMAGMLSVNTGSGADSSPLTFRNPRAKAKLHKLFAFAETPPVNAQIKVFPQGGITVTPSKEGDVLDMDVLLQDLDAAASNAGGLRTVFVALTTAMPALSAEDVQTMGLSALGAQFVTYFDPRNTARAGNIALAAKLVDGTLIKPGGTFSLNAAMGPRSANRGFDYAPVIASDMVLRQGVGGGICQYATTLFNAALIAGLPIVEREAHSLYISHYPIGRDATVSWGSADLKFRNDTGKTLMIRSWVEGDHLTVALVGKTGREATFKTSGFYDIRKPGHGKGDPRVIYDSDLGPGVTRWEQGIDGRSVRVERTVRNTQGEVLFRDAFVSHYQPLDWVKRVGT
jgi:vancomycin resistance protein YoaR